MSKNIIQIYDHAALNRIFTVYFHSDIKRIFFEYNNQTHLFLMSFTNANGSYRDKKKKKKKTGSPIAKQLFEGFLLIGFLSMTRYF